MGNLLEMIGLFGLEPLRKQYTEREENQKKVCADMFALAEITRESSYKMYNVGKTLEQITAEIAALPETVKRDDVLAIVNSNRSIPKAEFLKTIDEKLNHETKTLKVIKDKLQQLEVEAVTKAITKKGK